MLKLVLPKGSLEEQTLLLLQEADLSADRGGDREYAIEMEDPRISQIKMLRPQEIPIYVERGLFDLGITGLDWVREMECDVVQVLDLGYNKQGIGRPVRIVLAVDQDSPVTDGREIQPGSRISTEYPNLTRAYFQGLGIPVDILLSYGATEAKVPEIADAIVDLAETGTTLRSQGLKIVDVLLESSAKLIANRDSFADRAKGEAIGEVATLLEGVLEARRKVLIKLNVHEKHLDGVIGILPAMKAPTISRLFGSDFYAVETVVTHSEVNMLIPRLKEEGAEDILEIPILKIIK
jgi:ATP phosphoribosyltransferase